MLTRIEIENAMPGRSLDRLVAPLAGWTYKRSISRWVEPGGGMAHVNPPAFSLEIAAAWQLVEKLKQVGSLGFQLTYSPDRKQWECGPLNYGDYGEPELYSTDCGIGDTVPLAICRAALAAHLKSTTPTTEKGAELC